MEGRTVTGGPSRAARTEMRRYARRRENRSTALVLLGATLSAAAAGATVVFLLWLFHLV